MLLFLAAAATYCVTAYPSVGLRNSGELVSAASTIGVSHAPGFGLYMMILRAGSLIPWFGDIAGRMNLVSAFISAAVVSLVYLVTARLVARTLVHDPRTEQHPLLIHAGGVIGALTLAFSDSFWANANQAEIANPAVLLALGIVWAFLRWSEGAGYALFLLAYIFGLCTSQNWFLLSLIIPLAIYGMHRVLDLSGWGNIAAAVISLLVFVVVYMGISSWWPSLVAMLFPHASAAATYASILFVLISVCLPLAFLRRVPVRIRKIALATGMFLVGTSTNLVVPLRAGMNPAVNTGYLATVADFRDYHSGSEFTGPSSVLQRRWDRSEATEHFYSRYTSDASYFFSYQLQQTFMRFFLWNFVGRASEKLLAGPAFPGLTDEDIRSDPGNEETMFPKNYYAIPFGLGVLGLFSQLRKTPATGMVLLLGFLLTAVVPVVVLNTGKIQGAETDGFYVIPFAFFSVFVGNGAAALARWWRGSAGSMSAPAGILTVIFALVPLNMMRLNAADHHHGADYTTPDFAYNLLQSCDSSAVLVTEGNDDTYPLIYLQQAAGIRRDIRVVNRALLNTGWYSRQCLLPSPDGAASPVISGLPAKEIQALAEPGPYALLQTGWLNDQKEVRIPVPRQLMKMFAAQRPKRPRQGIDSASQAALPTEMVYYARAEYPVSLDTAGETVRFYRPWREVMLENIIRTAAWKRPVYFAVTCDRDALTGIEEFLRLEGLAWRVTPVSFSDEPYLLSHAVAACLFTPTDEMAVRVRRGFLHRSHPHGQTTRDPGVLGYAVNYRNVYLRYAEYLRRFAQDTKGMVKTLHEMERTLPGRIYPVDYRYLYDIALLYRAAGEKETWERLRNRIVAECLGEIQRHEGVTLGVHSPYRYLLEMYQFGREYQKALALLDSMQRLAPRAEDIRAKRQEILEDIQNTYTQ